jgi:hypothetical protein
LVILAAQPGPVNGFAIDALTKNPMNWVTKTANPVFGAPTSKLCVAQVSGAPVSPTVRYGDLVKNTAVSCDPALWAYNTVSAGAALPTLPVGVQSIMTWSGDANCPGGFLATGGGGVCTGGGAVAGTTTFSRPVLDASGNPVGWHLDCCIASAQPPGTPESIPNDVSAVCVKPN